MRTMLIDRLRGYALTLIAVSMFGGTFIAGIVGSRGFSLMTMSFGRVILGAISAAVLLKLMGLPLLPQRKDLPVILVVSLGTVVAFPFLSTLALHSISAANAAVVNSLTPLLAAAFFIAIGERKTRFSFWVVSGITAVATVAMAITNGGLDSQRNAFFGYLALIGGIISVGVGVIAGRHLAAKIGQFQMLCWALISSVPIQVPGLIIDLFVNPLVKVPSLESWIGFIYAGLFSIVISNLLLERGISYIGSSSAQFVQLAQPIVTIVLSILILNNHISPSTWVVAGLAILSGVFNQWTWARN
jgi:drug/metabolite transporter (DMT)-like permease